MFLINVNLNTFLFKNKCLNGEQGNTVKHDVHTW